MSLFAVRFHPSRAPGPISVTIHVTNDASSRQELLDSLHALYTTSPYMSTYVDVHLVVDSFDRQFNMWRNVAKFFSRTDFVMMLDVDFAICTDFRSRILRSLQVMEKLEQGNAAFVIPAFEYAAQEDGLDPSTFPKQKADLMKLVEQDKIGMFHAFWKPGHGSTNYTRYYEAKAAEVYKVNQYTHAYEPYVIFKKEGTPYCDERFIGYGAK
jgi:glycosyltransferase-like protein LARGE